MSLKKKFDLFGNSNMVSEGRREAAPRGGESASGLVAVAAEKQAMTRLRQLSQAAGLVRRAPAGGGANPSLLSQVPVRE